MSIFFWAVLAHYGLPAAIALALLILLALAFRLADYARVVAYRATIDYLELRGRWHQQEQDQHITARTNELRLIAARKQLVDGFRAVEINPFAVEIEPAPGDQRPAWAKGGEAANNGAKR